MYAIFGLSTFICPFLFLGIAIYFIIIYLSPPMSLMGYIRPVRYTVLAIASAVALAGTKPVFWTVVALIEKLGLKVFPNINGTWHGQIRSNRGAIERMMKAARGKEQPFDPAQAPFDAEPDDITLHIAADFFKIIIHVKGSRIGSRSIAVRPRRGDDKREPSLIYVYRTEVHNRRQDDDRLFYGASILEIIDGEPLRMTGHFWTDRRWEQGLNTAGRIEVRKISPDPRAPLTKGPSTAARV